MDCGSGAFGQRDYLCAYDRGKGEEGKKASFGYPCLFSMCGGNQRSAARRIFLDLFVTADGGVFIFGLYFAYRAGIVLDGGNLLCDLGVYVMAVIVGAVSGLQTVYDLLSRRKSVHFFSRRESYFCRGSYRYGVYRGKVAAGAWKKEDRPKAVYDGGFQMRICVPENMEEMFREGSWISRYLIQVLLAVVLYLQNELFKKSEMRKELEIMNLLWKTEQEQYRIDKENIALINQKCHDLKHQIYALRNVSEEERNRYLDEIAESVQIYEAMVKTGNEVLDTILTEKSLHCKEKGITVSCVADGSQMDFINTVDLYAILGNAIDNAIEAVEKLEEKEKRQIDVLIYRKEQFLAIHVINPLAESLVYEDGLPVTTKENKKFHGFGLKSIKYMVKKRDGILSIREEAGCFSLMILIPIPQTT